MEEEKKNGSVCFLHRQAQAQFDIEVEKSSSSIERTNERTNGEKKLYN